MTAIGDLAGLLDSRQVVVCAGAGGVGKTTVSASLALAAARRGRRVLALTIDPSRRLAQTLGVQAHALEPVLLAPERLEKLGVRPPGALSAWMLDVRLVSDDAVRRLTPDAGEGEQLLQNRFYRNISNVVAGMHEFTAVEALYNHVEAGRYDLVVLDTPPAGDARRFLNAPSRASRFIDPRFFKLFLPDEGGMMRRAAAKFVESVMDVVFGTDTRAEIQAFFAGFGPLMANLADRQERVAELFRDPARCGFLLVTTPERGALEEAAAFEASVQGEHKVPFAGYVLNATLHDALEQSMPDHALLPEAPEQHHRDAVEGLRTLAALERTLGAEHAEVAEGLKARCRRGQILRTLPRLSAEADALESLVGLADRLVAPPDAG